MKEDSEKSKCKYLTEEEAVEQALETNTIVPYCQGEDMCISYNLIQTIPGTQIEAGVELLRRWGRYIKEMHRVQGEFDYIVELETKSEWELRKVLRKHLSKISKISGIRTMIVD